MTLLEYFESHPEILEMLRLRQITNRTVAAQVGVSEAHLARVLAGLGVKKQRGEVVKQREAAKTLAETRKKHRQSLAKAVILGKKTIEQAAIQAGCSERTLYRYVQQLSNV